MDLKYFAYEHLPPKLQVVSEPFGLLARRIAMSIPDCEQKEVCLQKLLEAKDACVRAALPDMPQTQATAMHTQYNEAREKAEAAISTPPTAGAEIPQGFVRIDPNSIPNKDK